VPRYTAFVASAPEPSIDHRRIAHDHFGVDGTATLLPGHEDTNARVQSSSGERFVLRVSPRDPDLDRLRFVDEAMQIARRASFDVPSSVPTITGDSFARLDGDRVARLLTWVEGVAADEAGRPSSAAPSIGRVAAEMVQILAPMSQRFHRDDTTWDPGRSHEVILRFRPDVTSTTQRALVDQVLTRLRDVPFRDLPRQVIHSDLNAGNLVLTGETVTGVIDFEDALPTIRIGELSAACAYAMLTHGDPVPVAMDVIAGYRQHAAVTEVEASHLFTLTLSRVAVSVCVAASLPPGNPHHHRDSSITWELLTRLLTEDIDALADLFKDASLL
jgi:Ser/Thr protein kinase RdoA (MazF antagonist)